MIRVLRVPLPHLHSTAIALRMRGGPRFEGPRESGLTHFLEHMFFRGSLRHPEPRALMAAFEALGGEPDAHTADDELGITLEVAPDRVPAAARLLADVLERPAFRDLERERRIIREELLDLVDAKGRPLDLDDLARQVVFAGHSLARSVIGREADVRRYAKRDLERMRARLVRDGNVVVAIAGPVGAAEERAVARAFGRIPSGPALEDPWLVPAPSGPRTAFVPDGAGESCDVRVSFLAPGESDPRAPVLRVLANVLDGGPLARVPLRLVDAGFVHAAQLSIVPFPDVSLVELDFTVSGARFGQTFRRALDVLLSVGREGLDAGELARARERLRVQRLFARDDAAGEAEWIARRTLFGLPASREGDARALEGVTAREVKEVARALFVPERFVGVLLGRPPLRERLAARRAIGRW